MKHHQELITQYSKALSRGTWRNKSTQVAAFLDFCTQRQLQPLSLQVYDILSYLLVLGKTGKTPGTIMNYLSGAKTWVKASLGAVSAFDSYPVSIMKRGIYNNSVHVPKKAHPITPSALKGIVRYLLSAGASTKVFVAALLIGYFTLLRQSNLVPLSAEVESAHSLSFGDVVALPGTLLIRVLSTKTRSRGKAPAVFSLPMIPGSEFCPLNAWQKYAASVSLLPSSPAFVLPSGVPLTSPVLTAMLRLASTGLRSELRHEFSLHGLRRGAAQACESLGVPVEEIMEAGTWQSSCVYAYLRGSPIAKAPAALAKLFG